VPWFSWVASKSNIQQFIGYCGFGLRKKAYRLLAQQVLPHLHDRFAPCNQLPYQLHPLKTHLNRTLETILIFLPPLPAPTKSRHYHVALPAHHFLQILTMNQTLMTRRFVRML
jgi:hypothetical protein